MTIKVPTVIDNNIQNCKEFLLDIFRPNTSKDKEQAYLKCSTNCNKVQTLNSIMLGRRQSEG